MKNDEQAKSKVYDAVVIGGGPGGVSAALYIARGNRSVAIVDGGASALLKAHAIQNFYGVGTVSGTELYRSGLSQAAEVGAEIINAQATACAYDGERFMVTLDGGEALTSRTLVIATGAARAVARIAGLKEYEGRGVSYCAVCDAFFYRKKHVGVIGAGAFAEHELSALYGVVGKVDLLCDGCAPAFAAPDGVDVYTRKIARIVGGDTVSGVVFDDGTEVGLDGVFVALGTLGAVGIAKSVGVLSNEAGEIVIDERGMTNIDGLYAVGDCTPGIKQIAKAVNDGMTVGTEIVKKLRH